MVTKWDLTGDAGRAALDAVPFLDWAGNPGRCAGCGESLPTEGAFARHFVLPDRRYLNLGYCPGDPAPVGPSAEVHVRTGADGSVWVWALALGGADSWRARVWARVRTRDGVPLLVHALCVNDGNAGVRLGQAMTMASVRDGVPCSLWVRGVLVEEWTAQDIADLAPGVEVY